MSHLQELHPQVPATSNCRSRAANSSARYCNKLQTSRPQSRHKSSDPAQIFQDRQVLSFTLKHCPFLSASCLSAPCLVSRLGLSFLVVNALFLWVSGHGESVPCLGIHLIMFCSVVPSLFPDSAMLLDTIEAVTLSWFLLLLYHFDQVFINFYPRCPRNFPLN
ncbi:hypothetical protein B0H14DRAFT_854597 [Mycena olivaceomarginata]|nr:hypothetical protein B0H14DRAFT_854597 [Mycena olivaceomarginata]